MQNRKQRCYPHRNKIFVITAGMSNPIIVRIDQQIKATNKYGTIDEKLSEIAGGTLLGNLILMLYL